jgi:hypothetical protein
MQLTRLCTLPKVDAQLSVTPVRILFILLEFPQSQAKTSIKMQYPIWYTVGVLFTTTYAQTTSLVLQNNRVTADCAPTVR